MDCPTCSLEGMIEMAVEHHFGRARATYWCCFCGTVVSEPQEVREDLTRVPSNGHFRAIYVPTKAQEEHGGETARRETIA